jgi:hypothetical protein
VVNVNNPKEEVLGFFSVNAITRKSRYIDKSELPFYVSELVFANDCRLIPNSTTQKPDFWQ